MTSPYVAPTFLDGFVYGPATWQQLADEVQALSTGPAGVTPLTLQNGWTNRSATDANFPDSCTWKVPEPVNEVRVLLQLTPPGSPSGTVCTTLPLGYRPSLYINLPITGRIVAAPGPAPSVTVQDDGQIVIYDVSPGNAVGALLTIPLITLS